MPRSYGTTLPKDPSCRMACSWAMADPSTFAIRGESYLHDHQKVPILLHVHIVSLKTEEMTCSLLKIARQLTKLSA